MIIERIKIQFHINQSLRSARAMDQKISKIAVDVLDKLNKAMQELLNFKQKYPFFSKLIRFINKRFGIQPLQKEIEKVKLLIPVEKPKPQPILKTPVGTVEVDIPELPLEIPRVVIPPPAKKNPLEIAVQTFKAQYKECFQFEEKLNAVFMGWLEKMPAANRMKSLDGLSYYLKKTEEWVPPESYLIHILNSPESIPELIYFLDKVFEKREALTPEKLEEEIEPYIDDVFNFGLYLIPGVAEMLPKDKVEAFLLDPLFETESIKEYIESIIEELDGSNPSLLKLLQECLQKIDPNAESS